MTELGGAGAPTPTGWRPANATERAMADAAERDDRSGYFRALLDAELYLPGFSDETESEAQRFVTWDLLGGTHLLVFTSVAALRQAVGGFADSYRLTSYAELRNRWPSPDWRLGINPGTPIDAYLEVDGVAQAAEGVLTVPTGDDLIRSVKPAEVAPSPLNEMEEGLLAAIAARDTAEYVQVLLTAEVALPIGRPVADDSALYEPDFPWYPVDMGGGPAIEVFTSPERLGEAYGPDAPHLTVPLVAVLVVWPGTAYRLSVDPGTEHGLTLSGEQADALADVAEDLLAAGDEQSPDGEPTPDGEPNGRLG
jgi:hypothetical protein